MQREEEPVSTLATPNTGATSNRKLSSQFGMSAHNSQQKALQVAAGAQATESAPGPYTYSANVTIDHSDQISQSLAVRPGSKRSKF